jgi:hypothetical protein
MKEKTKHANWSTCCTKYEKQNQQGWHSMDASRTQDHRQRAKHDINQNEAYVIVIVYSLHSLHDQKNIAAISLIQTVVNRKNDKIIFTGRSIIFTGTIWLRRIENIQHGLLQNCCILFLCHISRFKSIYSTLIIKIVTSQ